MKTTTNNLRALDLFCCAGGATKGLQIAGYHVTGVDIKPQPHYCGDVFHQDDAMAWLRGERESLKGFDLIWASPPCQRYSESTPPAYKNNHPDLLPEVCGLLRAQNVLYIVENVEMAAHLLRTPIKLCGSMFGLDFWRHRYFEIGNPDVFFLTPPCDHSFVPVLITGQGSHLVDGKRVDRAPVAKQRVVMGTDWMSRDEITEAIPPAYSRFLAEQVGILV
jgi:DNA (cytosine-5)-methyltransferase 1